MPNRSTWIATFDGAAARLLAFDRLHHRLVEIEAWRGPHRAHFSDRPDRVQESAAPQRSALEPRTDPERALEDAFAADVAARLDAAASAGRFDRLIVAAAPRALRAFRAALTPPLADRIAAEIDRVYVNAPLEDVLRGLADAL